MEKRGKKAKKQEKKHSGDKPIEEYVDSTWSEKII